MSGKVSNTTSESVTHISKTYHVYRGLSPTSASRLENRNRELEDAIDFERDARVRVRPSRCHCFTHTPNVLHNERRRRSFCVRWPL